MTLTELIKFHTVVVRIAGSETARSRMSIVVRETPWPAEQEQDAALRLLPGVPQPHVIGGHVVPPYEDVPTVGPKPAGRS